MDMKNSYKKILHQVPPDYYERGTRTNLLQWAWHSWKWRTLSSMLDGVKGKVLDIGCADGNLTNKIFAYLPDAQVTGVDLYTKSIKFAQRKNSGVEFMVADARKLPFGAKQFDCIVCVEALEHIPQNYKALREIKRCLKDNGTLIIVQDTDSLLFNTIWFFWTKWKGKVWEGSHIACMKPKELVELLEREGFKILNKKYSHLGLEVAISACKK